MSVSLVMTVIGRDEPGLVESLASVIEEHGGNWEESRMARLAGQFAGILRVAVEAGRAESLKEAIEALSADGMACVVARADADAAVIERRMLVLEIVGQDRPGIVRHLSEVIADRGVNVDELETECAAAPMSGDMLFRARATLSAPMGVSIDELRDALEQVAGEWMVDIELGLPE
jgi:glycine cleavage system regulatory protein